MHISKNVFFFALENKFTYICVFYIFQIMHDLYMKFRAKINKIIHINKFTIMINELFITMTSPKLDIKLQKRENGNIVVTKILYYKDEMKPDIREFKFKKQQSEIDFIINTIYEMKKINEQS